MKWVLILYIIAQSPQGYTETDLIQVPMANKEACSKAADDASDIVYVMAYKDTLKAFAFQSAAWCIDTGL